MIQVCITVAALSLTVLAQSPSDLQDVQGLSCPKAGYMYPDPQDLCSVWFCESAGAPPINRKCPKGVRVPTWWDGGELNMCFKVNIEKHGGEPTCSRCAIDDPVPDHQGCSSNPCPDECTCEDIEHTYRCNCPEREAAEVTYVPPPRDHCEPNQCENGATCQNQWDGFFCFCPSGWTGHRCETPICDWFPCFNGGTCVADGDRYYCECTDCWTGSCCNVTIPGCIPGGEPCPLCFTGENCDTPLNTCACLPPEDQPCQAGGVCVDGDDGPECEEPPCKEPECYIDNCKVRKDTCECTQSPCPENSRCENLIDVNSHECICDDCWEGPSCNIKSSSCACSNPCEKGALCKETKGGLLCECGPCTSGIYCEEKVVSCECSSPCGQGESCRDTETGPVCYCDSDCHFGAGCANIKNTCECNNPCSPGQECTMVNGSPSCGCSDPCKYGPNCSDTIQTCECLKPCVGKEVCQDGVDGPFCSCTDLCTYGEGCSLKYDTCECNNPCSANQVCDDVGGVPTCGCSNLCMEGVNCDIPINTCYCNNPCNSAQECYLRSNGEHGCRCADSCYEGEFCDKLKQTCECSPCTEGEICLSDDKGAKTGCGCSDPCTSGPGCQFVVDTCECNNPCAKGEVCSERSDGQLTCGCTDPCKHGPGCTETVNTCQCNSPCAPGEKCGKSDSDSADLYCYCEDACKTGPGCTDTVNTCKCQNTCTGDEVCVDGVDGAAPTCICEDKCTYGEGCSLIYNTCECNSNCNPGQICTMVDGNPVCGCADPCKTGPYCGQDVATCACQPCLDGEACRDTDDGGPQCYCADACYTGFGCTDKVNTCECNNSCNEGQECYLDPNNNQPACRCADSCYEGDNCERRITSCRCGNPCQGYGECVDAAGGIICDACFNPCHTGPRCQDPINTCECNNPCSEYEVCSDIGGTPTCSCPSCYEGATCSDRIDSCACNNPCSDNGRCHESLDGAVCRCDACWAGEACDQPMNTCECASTCQSYEVCKNDRNGGHVCECPDCYEGPDCSVRVDSCRCNNKCTPADLCSDTEKGPICKCDCKGNEVCVRDPITYREECRCRDCYFNKPGERGCPSTKTHTCECNQCQGYQQVCTDNEDINGNIVCDIANPSSGTHFTVVFEENNTERPVGEIPLEIYCASAVWNDGTRTVRITTPGLGAGHSCHVDKTEDILENTVGRYPLERCLRQNGTGLDHLAIRIEEVNNKSISCYGINKDRYSADGFLALPDKQAGKEFQTSSFSPAHIATQFAIVALSDKTQVTIKLADDCDLPPPNNKKGDVYTVTLQAFDTFQVQARCPGHIPSLETECTLDLTGTEIIASKSIHVFSGNIRAWSPGIKGKSRDHLVEQLLPRDRWGTDFAFISVPNRVIGDLIQIMAFNGQATRCHLYSDKSDDPTIINLPKHDRYHVNQDIASNGLYRLICDYPVLVTQITKSQDQIYRFYNESFHDPVTITVPPLTQFTNNFFLNTPDFTGGVKFNPQPYNTTFALLVAQKGEEGYITLNQQSVEVFESNWRDIPASPDEDDQHLVGAVIRVPHGTNIIRNSEGHNFQCLVYGYDDRESYGFPAGMALGKFIG